MWHVELTGVIGPLISIVFGILIIIFPWILNYLVASYFIIAGVVGLLLFVT
jgi:hypothetical protein